MEILLSALEILRCAELEVIRVPGLYEPCMAPWTVIPLGLVRDSEWTRRAEVLAALFRPGGGQPWLDLFASRNNALLSHFVSPILIRWNTVLGPQLVVVQSKASFVFLRGSAFQRS